MKSEGGKVCVGVGVGVGVGGGGIYYYIIDAFRLVSHTAS